MRQSNAHGRFGEEETARRLIERGWRLLARNYRCRYGEIDLIFQDGEVLAFVEVKTRQEDAWFAPFLAVDARKRRRILETATMFLMEHPLELQPRFDVAEVVVKVQEYPVVAEFRYWENAFET